jgi:hypothetical protein
MRAVATGRPMRIPQAETDVEDGTGGAGCTGFLSNGAYRGSADLPGCMCDRSHACRDLARSLDSVAPKDRGVS